MRRKLDLQIAVWKEGKYYVSRCLNVNVSSFGKTKASALKSLDEALALYFEDEDISKVAEVKNPEIVAEHFQYA